MNTIIAEENLQDYLKVLGANDGVSIGLIIGQVNDQKCHVIHLAPTPEQSKDKSLGNVKDFDEIGLGDHAQYVIRMLPGGLHIVGIFVVSKSDVFVSSNFPVIRKLLKTVNDKLCDKFFLDPQIKGNMMLMHYNGQKNQITVKRFHLDALKDVNWSFKSSIDSWYEITTTFNVKETLYDTHAETSFRVSLDKLLDAMLDRVQGLTLYLDGAKYDQDKVLETVFKRPSGERQLTGNLYKELRAKKTEPMRISDCAEQMTLEGVVASRAYLHPRSTIKDALEAVKLDILRSLAARIEMHWDTFVDGANGPTEGEGRLHEPPRRVLLRPTGWKITISDYLFPGEPKDECIKTCKELLDQDVILNDIIDDFEILNPCLTPQTDLTVLTDKFLSKPYIAMVGAAVAVMSVLLYNVLY